MPFHMVSTGRQRFRRYAGRKNLYHPRNYTMYVLVAWWILIYRVEVVTSEFGTAELGDPQSIEPLYRGHDCCCNVNLLLMITYMFSGRHEVQSN